MPKKIEVPKDGPGTNDRWIRLPGKIRCPFTGLPRAKFYELIKAGKIKTASLREPGCTRGIRLVWLPSLLAYIESHVDGGKAA